MSTGDVITLVGAIIQAMATAFVGIVLWKQARQIKQMEFNKSMVDALNHMNSIALPNEKLLEKFEKMVEPNSEDKDLQTKWALFMWLNIMEVMFLNRRLIDKEISVHTSGPIIDLMLKNDGKYILELLQTRGYSHKFTEYIRDKYQQITESEPST